MDRNTLVGADFLVIGAVVSALGYIGAQSIPIAVFGFAVAIIGALVLLIVPEPIPQDAFKALLQDSITNIEIVLEESQLKEKAYFLPSEDGKIRAFIPLINQTELSSDQLLRFDNAPKRFVVNYGDIKGLMLIPPGNEIVRLSKVQKDDDLEEALRNALVGYSDLASSVLTIEEDKNIKIQINSPKLSSQSPYFNECLGSPASCVASSVVAAVRGPVRIADEKFDRALIRLTLDVI